MTKATGRGSYAGNADDFWTVARDHARWDGIMPGVLSSKVAGDGTIEWRIQTPMGESLVRFASAIEDDVFAYRSTEAEAPFKAIEVDLALRDGAVSLDFTIEAEPPFPPPMVEQLAQAAVGRLCDIANRATPSPSADREPVKIAMSDGVQLDGHLYRTSAAVAPCIVTLFPYRKESAFLPTVAAELSSWGYHLVVVDVRGIGGSGGTYEGLWSKREVDDFAELVAATAAMDFCDGNVATFGGSYCGGNQLLVAARKPEALRCITPIVGMVDTYRDWTHRGGLASHANWGAMTYLRSQHRETARQGLEQYYMDFFGDDLDNDAHRERSAEARLAAIDVPTLSIGGWHDYFLRGTVRTYLNVAGSKRLVIGPWGHGDPPPLHELRRWFDHWVRGEGDLPATKARVYVTGADEWRELDDWPHPSSTEYRAWHPVTEPTELRVVSHVEALPMATNVKPQFVPDPTDSGFSVWSEDATFDTEPFDEPTLMLGHVGCALRLTVDGCDDAAVRVRLSVVTSEGSVRQLNEGRLRLSQRAVDIERSLSSPSGEVVVPWHTHEVQEPLGGPVDVNVEIDPIGHLFDAGDRLRFGITLTRADEGVDVARATLDPSSRLLLPIG